MLTITLLAYHMSYRMNYFDLIHCQLIYSETILECHGQWLPNLW